MYLHFVCGGQTSCTNCIRDRQANIIPDVTCVSTFLVSNDVVRYIPAEWPIFIIQNDATNAMMKEVLASIPDAPPAAPPAKLLSVMGIAIRITSLMLLDLIVSVDDDDSDESLFLHDSNSSVAR